MVSVAVVFDDTSGLPNATHYEDELDLRKS